MIDSCGGFGWAFYLNLLSLLYALRILREREERIEDKKNDDAIINAGCINL